MSLTSYRAAPPRGKSMRLDFEIVVGRGSARLEDLAATYSPVP